MVRRAACVVDLVCIVLVILGLGLGLGVALGLGFGVALVFVAVVVDIAIDIDLDTALALHNLANASVREVRAASVIDLVVGLVGLAVAVTLVFERVEFVIGMVS